MPLKELHALLKLQPQVMITEIIQRGDFKGELYKTFLIHKTQENRSAPRAPCCLGQAKDCTIDKVRGAASYGARFIRDMGIKHFIVPGSFGSTIRNIKYGSY